MFADQRTRAEALGAHLTLLIDEIRGRGDEASVEVYAPMRRWASVRFSATITGSFLEAAAGAEHLAERAIGIGRRCGAEMIRTFMEPGADPCFSHVWLRFDLHEDQVTPSAAPVNVSTIGRPTRTPSPKELAALDAAFARLEAEMLALEADLEDEAARKWKRGG